MLTHLSLHSILRISNNVSVLPVAAAATSIIFVATKVVRSAPRSVQLDRMPWQVFYAVSDYLRTCMRVHECVAAVVL